MSRRSELFRELLEKSERSDNLLRFLHKEHSTLVEYVQNHEGICAQEQEGDTSLAAVLIRYLESMNEPLLCDYCKVETDDPWHGSGMVKGKEQRHIHACDACRHLLPAHGMQYVWLNIEGDPKYGGFSIPWDDADPERMLKNAQELMAEKPELNSYKLLQYRCLTDREFVFTTQMKLR